MVKVASREAADEAGHVAAEAAEAASRMTDELLANGRAMVEGGAEAGRELLRAAQLIYDSSLPGGAADGHLIAGLQSITRLKDSVQSRDQAGLHQAVTSLRSVTNSLSPEFPLRARLDAALGAACSRRGFTFGPV